MEKGITNMFGNRIERIAMDCNKEQFKSIKHLFKSDQILDSSIDFDKYRFLTNDYHHGGKVGLGTHSVKMVREGVKLLYKWDKNKFLEACGIKEVSENKEYNSDEFEFYNTYGKKWETLGTGSTKIRFKPKETQLDLQIEIAKKTCINVVTCGNCGSTLLHRQEDETITCPDCKHEGEPCDFPDLNY